jgi:hypothetical protein
MQLFFFPSTITTMYLQGEKVSDHVEGSILQFRDELQTKVGETVQHLAFVEDAESFLGVVVDDGHGGAIIILWGTRPPRHGDNNWQFNQKIDCLFVYMGGYMTSTCDINMCLNISCQFVC